MKTKYKYIEFHEHHTAKKWTCVNYISSETIGYVVQVLWKMWVFCPRTRYEMEFSCDCLRDIAHFLEQLNEKKKENTPSKNTEEATTEEPTTEG